MFRVVCENPVTFAIEQCGELHYAIESAQSAVKELTEKGYTAWIINLETGEIL